MPSTMMFAQNFSGVEIQAQKHRALEHLETLGDRSPALRASLLAKLAAAVVVTDAEEAYERVQQCEEAAQIAGDEGSRAWALLARAVCDLSSHTTKWRKDAMREVLDIAASTQELGFVSTAHFLLLSALVELGELDEVEQALSPLGQELSRFPLLREGRHVAWFRCMQVTLNGEISPAEQLAQEAFALAQEAGDPDAEAVYVGQLGIIRWAQGRVVELEPLFLQALRQAPHEPIWGATLAWIWLKQGRCSAAQALLDSLPPVDQLALDRNWLSTLCILAEVASQVGDLPIATELYAQLHPFSERLVTIGLGITCWGTTARGLAKHAG